MAKISDHLLFLIDAPTRVPDEFNRMQEVRRRAIALEQKALDDHSFLREAVEALNEANGAEAECYAAWMTACLILVVKK